jgi:hypothetical protein
MPAWGAINSRAGAVPAQQACKPMQRIAATAAAAAAWSAHLAAPAAASHAQIDPITFSSCVPHMDHAAQVSIR